METLRSTLPYTARSGDKAWMKQRAGWSPGRSLFSLLFVLVFLIFGELVSYLAGGPELTAWVNQVFPVVLLLSLLWTGFQMVRAYPLMIWSPLPWFFGACAVYYGLGPLLYYFGNEESIWNANQFYAVDEKNILRTNLLNVVGIALVVLSFLFASKVTVFTRFPGPTAFNAKIVKRIVILFLVIGIPIKYLLGLPYVFGLLDITLPGSIFQFKIFSSLAIIPVMFLLANGYSRWRFVLYVLISSEILVSVLTFAKLEMLITLIILFLGWFSFFDRRGRVVVLAAGLFVFVYMLAGALVSFARTEIIETFESEAGFEERIRIVNRYLESEGGYYAYHLPGVQTWWTRLNYANAQAFALNAYDNSLPGNSFELLPYTVIPRLMWPDKPIMTATGPAFNYLVTGNPNSASAPGLFAEAYWNGGWLLVITACFYVGILFAGFTHYAVQHIGSLNLLFVPIVFMGIEMGFRPDAWFVPTYVGSLVIAICLHYVLKLGFSCKRSYSRQI